ncbi:restriction endonuclease subunit S [Sulfuricurvum sp.]|uniref:restriction endonuclease subunit S n=1 Tax=Sulfuricurvum sp. TaxID=2025608 RepID=UPI002602460E|nr:restriction endonuclease subunit S [Sulfuricurvum sp.]MDD3598101.1 restriction endonuclease subunit S [Sulfuricurvum sp.]
MTSNLPTLPNGWEWKKLGSVCSFIRGPFGGSLKKQIFIDSGYAVFEQSHAIYDSFVSFRYFIDENKFNEMKRFKIQEGSLIMSCSGTIGKVAIVPKGVQQGIINQALLMLTPDKNLYNRFLKFLMQSSVFQNNLSEYTTGAAINNIASVKILKEIRIPLPPLEEQKRLVSLLDTLFAKIDRSLELLSENITAADALLPSALNTVFGELEEKWESENFDSICKNIKYGHTAKASDIGNAVFLRITDIDDDGKIKTDTLKYTTVDEKEFDKYKVDQDDILIARSGATAGKVSLWDLEHNAIFASYLIKFSPIKEKINARYLFNFCHSPMYWKQLNLIKVGGAQPNVNATNLKEITIPLPPLDIQTQTVAYLDSVRDKVEMLKKAQNDKKARLIALKASILDRAFKGAL